MGHIYAFITCTRIKWECEDEGCEHYGCMDYPQEEDGWIDRRWSPYVLYDSRNDVTPVVDVDESSTEDLANEVQDALSWLEGGYENCGDGTFYANETYQPYDDPWGYSYALHFMRKFYGPKGWTEEPWTPPADMLP